MLTLSNDGLKQLELLEGLPGGLPALTAYQDSAGVWTIGFGHTGDVSPTMQCTASWAELTLRKDVTSAESAVAALVTASLNQNQFDALVIFVFNIGVGAFQGSTLLKLLNQGNYDAVPTQLALWNKVTVGGQKVVSNGLINRRAAEIALWTKALPSAPIEVQGTPPTPVKPADSPIKTTTGRTVIATLVSGGGAAALQGVSQAQTYLNAFSSVLSGTTTEKQWYQVGTVVFVIIAIGFSLWTYINNSRKLKE